MPHKCYRSVEIFLLSGSVTVSGNRNAFHMLPSYLKRRAGGENVKSKKPKSVKTWDRDVLCLPDSRKNRQGGGSIKYPRGKYRSDLANAGLIGKLHLTSEMTDLDVANEIRSIFKGPMRDDPQFPFLYLQPTGGGSKSLTIPSQSSSFRWIPQQVARLSGQTNMIYILAQSELALPDNVEVGFWNSAHFVICSTHFTSNSEHSIIVMDAPFICL